VLPFHSPLFEPAIRAQAPITAAAISYSASGVDESTLTYWGDKVFFPHLYATLGFRNLAGSIQFAENQLFADRKEAARKTHLQVTQLRHSNAASGPDAAFEHLSSRPGRSVVEGAAALESR
jgi:1-acyl-sn-glycerol-3-phosphate acyltransferase